MSNATLVLLITSAILAQVAVLGLFGWLRQRAQLRVLEQPGEGAAVGVARLVGTPEPNQDLDPTPVVQAIPAPAPAWPGHREFVVQRRVIEDGNGTVCSFNLSPADGQPLPTTQANAIAVRFSRSGKTVPWDGAAVSLLELAEGQGIAVNSGCRAGSCGTCETRIESGTVAYSQTPDAALKPGHCLLCISTPTADLTLAL
jgi:ferredoxin